MINRKISGSSVLFCAGLATLLVFGFVFSIQTAYASCPSGLRGYWRFENNLLDSAGSHNGTNSGASYLTGRVGNAINFNGSSHASFGTGTNLINGNNKATVAFWVNPSAGDSGEQQQTILCERLGGVDSDSSYQVYITTSNSPGAPPVGRIGFGIWNNDSIKNGANSSFAIPLNTWSFITATYDGSTIKMYVNGVLSGTGALTGNIKTLSAPLIIGSCYPNHLLHYRGSLDELMVFNKALSQSEINSLMNSNSDVCQPTPSTSCPFVAQANRYIVNFSGDKIVSNSSLASATQVAQIGNLITGSGSIKANVSLYGYDSYPERVGTSQPNERFFIKFRNGNTDVAVSNATSDLADNVAFAQVNQVVNTNLNIPLPIDNIVATHAVYPDNTNPNSLYPVCAAIDIIPTANLSVSCQSNPSSINAGQTANFVVSASGGTGSYSYVWSGGCTGSSANCTTTPSGSGNYTAYVYVSSGSQSATASCSVFVNNQTNNHAYTQCYNNDAYWYNSDGVRQELLQDCDVDNSNLGNYCVGNSVYGYGYSNGGCANGACYSPVGTPQLIQVCTGNQTCQNGSCVNTNNYNDHRGCYNNNAYWFDTYNTRQGLIQTCLYNQTCQNGYCVNTNNYNDHRGCYNNSVYWFDTYNTRQGLIETCLYNQTCQSGYCVNNNNYNDHRGCYNNSVYWFDTYNTRQGLIQTCTGNQTCQNGYCVNNYIPPTPSNYKGCYSNDLYWYDGSTNVRLSFYKSCSDNNACTLDSCSGSTCTNLLKCDGTTCASGSESYVKQCTVCGDGVCSQGETIQSCSQDCNVIGLAVTIFGKKENDPVQWAKSFGASADQDLDFLLVVSNGLDTVMNNVSVKTDLPSELLYRGGLKVDGNDYTGDVRSGITLGSLAPKSTRTITFKGKVADSNSIFRSEADALATVTTSSGSSQDTTRVVLNRTAYNDTDDEDGSFNPQQGLAGIVGINLANPLYLFLIIIIIILILLAIVRMVQGFRKG